MSTALSHTAVYAGVPAGTAAYAVAQRVLAEDSNRECNAGLICNEIMHRVERELDLVDERLEI
jgi:hypothetical protein